MTSSNTTIANQLYPLANGVSSSNAFVWNFLPRDPTPQDVNYPIQKFWLNTSDDSIWFLKSFSTNSGIVTANWIFIATGSVTLESFIMQTGITPITADGSGQITFNGSVVPAGTNPVRTDGTGANTMSLEVQIASSVSATDATRIGLAAFNSSQFSVDANGFVSLTGETGFTWVNQSGVFSALDNTGYFITGTATANLPASPAQGDTIKFFVDTTQILTIDAPGTQIIRFGSTVTAAGGTAVSTLRGDSVELTYRASDTCWCSIAGYTGNWTLT